MKRAIVSAVAAMVSSKHSSESYDICVYYLPKVFFKRYSLVSGHTDTYTEINFIKIPVKYWKIIIYSGISRGFVWAYQFLWSESWKEAGMLIWELLLKGQGLLEKVLHFHSGSLLNMLECFFGLISSSLKIFRESQ